MDFRCLGVGPAEQQLYEVLLDHPGVTEADLCELTGLPLDRLRSLLRSLARLGLMFTPAREPHAYMPAPPDIALGALAAERQEALDRARLAAAELARRTTIPLVYGPPVQVLEQDACAPEQLDRIQRLAREEVLVLHRGLDPQRRYDALLTALLTKGVRCRTIYDHDALDADRRKQLPHRAVAGEDARVLTYLPTELIVVDRTLALLPIVSRGDQATLLVRRSPLLDGLVALFGALWDRASPVWPKGHTTWRGTAADPLDAGDLQVLALLAAGMTIRDISEKLGMASRTVERRVRALMDRLGARTRFQAGLQAALRGWFPRDDDSSDNDV